ncbi:GAF domain-containing sensor histidine kinase [Flavobacterium alkalisoli]|nr:ATP-binding protein [Flavobacterium alkalisoli]
MKHLPLHLQKDINDISQISAIPIMLNVICQTTGMGFAAVARVTEEHWITCSVRDDIGFGLKPGDELEIKTTICDEIRQSGEGVIIDSVKDHPHFCSHHTPLMYGFQSYISIPIFKNDGSFFGTLCAIDPNPNIVTSEAVTGMFKLFASLISFHLNTLDSVRNIESQFIAEKVFNIQLEKKVFERTQQLEKSNKELIKINKELQSFNYISSHDLQEPLRKIQTIASLIEEREIDNLTERGKDYFNRIRMSAAKMQELISDLLKYSKTNPDENNFKNIDLNSITKEIIQDLEEVIRRKEANIVIDVKHKINALDFQVKQLLFNLISNALKFIKTNNKPIIKVSDKIGLGKSFDIDNLIPNVEYCCITIEDNGIGFEQKYSAKIFELFQSLHQRSKYEGTGIGLTIVKKIVENHNGIITAHGEPDKGAVFSVYLPQ